MGGDEIRKEYCPIHGKFTFTYDINDGSENKIECDNQVSQIETCSSPLPTSSLNLHFRSCSFSDHGKIHIKIIVSMVCHVYLFI